MNRLLYAFSKWYVRAAYVALVVILVLSLIVPVRATPQTYGTVSLSIQDLHVGYLVVPRSQAIAEATQTSTLHTSGGTGVASSGNLTAVANVPGGSSQSTITINGTTYYTEPAPIYLYGNVTLEYMAQSSNGSTYPVSVSEPIPFKNPYYVGQSYSIDVSFDQVAGKSASALGVMSVSANVVAESSDGYVLATTSSQTQPSVSPQLYYTIIALPEFNDSAFGAYAVSGQPQLPLGGLYNIIAIIGITVLVFSLLFAFFMPTNGRSPLSIGLFRLAVGTIAIVAFPYIYDKIAYLMNELNIAIIAYPYTSFAAMSIALNNVQSTIVTGVGLNIWDVLVFAYFIIEVIVYIFELLLGTVRIFLLGAMLVMFPLSVALRDIPFTQKLGRMIDDTLFGLILATVLSSVVLGVASDLITNWSAPYNMFTIAGIPAQWVAAAAVITAISFNPILV